jgi:hypothetical protein
MNLGNRTEEVGRHALDEQRDVGKIDGEIAGVQIAWMRRRGVPDAVARPSRKVWMPRPRAPTKGTTSVIGRSGMGKAEKIEVVVHGPTPPAASASPEGHVELTAGILLEGIDVNRAVALVAQEFDHRWPALFLRGLELAVSHTDQVHLQRFDEKILGIPAIGTRQRQNRDSVSGR